MLAVKAVVLNEVPVPSTVPPVGWSNQYRVPEPLAVSVVLLPLHILKAAAAVVLAGAGMLMVLTVSMFDVKGQVVTESLMLATDVLYTPKVVRHQRQSCIRSLYLF